MSTELIGTFDPELIEHAEDFEVDIAGETRTVGVEIYKIGGGTLGRKYEGYWGYRLTVRASENTVLMQGEDLHHPLPAAHDEITWLVLQFAEYENKIGDES